MKRKINRIVIVGGGTAGWSTALQFLRRTNNPKITVLASEEIPVIGIGESTTGLFNDLITSKSNLFIDEKDFIKKTGATFKIGIYHKDWHTIGESFTSPLGDDFLNQTGIPDFNYDYYRIYHIANKLKYYQMQSQFMMNNFVPFLWIDKEDPYPYVFENKIGKIDFRFHHIAYHIDAFKTTDYIKDKMLKHPRVEWIKGTVSKVEKDENNCVKSLITKDGQVIEGDLFVDCTGFFRLLIEKEYENNFISWRQNLLENNAILFPREYEENEPIKNYTTAQARKYGWEFNIPLQGRVSRGYIFNNEMINANQAFEELESVYGKNVNVTKEIKFNPGRMNRAWVKNVLSIGLSTGFVQPLEATAIHMTILQSEHFCMQFYSDYMDFNNESQNELYNKNIGAVWDDIRDFITLHYITPRNDTVFWTESSKKERLSKRMSGLLELWKTRMPRANDYTHGDFANFYNLGNTLWYQILIGMNLLDSELAKNELISWNLYNTAEHHYNERLLFNKFVINKAYSTNDFYKNQIDYLDDFQKVKIH
jgi:tryptophan halogenase